MPTDLDHLFANLGQQADAIPLATAEQARDRGRRRTRRQAAISAAVAVCLVAAGMGAALYRPRHDPDHTVGPTPSHALTEVGSPFEFGGTALRAVPSIGDQRAFTTWRAEDGTVRVNAVDLHTGKPAWPPRTVGKFDDVAGVFAVPQAVLVTVIPDQDAVPLKAAYPDSTMYVYDPADGRLRWKLASHDADDLVYYDRMLIRTSGESGVTEAYDWVTGAVRWRLPAGTDRAVNTLGMGTAQDSYPPTFTDDRLIRVMKSGQVQVRNATTGALVRTADIPPPGAANTYMAYDGQLVNIERSSGAASPFRVRGTDLSGTAKSVVLTSLGAGHEVAGMGQCGTGLLCVTDRSPDGAVTMLGVDVTQQRVRWRVDGPRDGGFAASRRGYTMLAGSESVVVDRNGKKLFGPYAGKLDWLGNDSLLTMPDTEAGIVSRVRLSDGASTPLGTVAGGMKLCQNTADRLVCATETDVRIWSLSG